MDIRYFLSLPTDFLATQAHSSLLKFSEWVHSQISYLLQEMVKLLAQFPLLKDFPQIYSIWKFMVFLSFSCIGIIMIVMASKSITGLGLGNVTRSLEVKVIFGRIVYMCIFIGLSLPFIDWVILFNNTLVEVLSSSFKLETLLKTFNSESSAGNFIATILMIVQMVFIVKIMIGYWLRVAEINLMAIISPALFVLWVNPAWGGYIGSWVKRIVTLITTGFIQVLLLVLYGMTVSAFFNTGTISSLCLAVATLILMSNVPQFFKQFTGSDSSIQIMDKTISKFDKRSASAVGKVANRINRRRNAAK